MITNLQNPKVKSIVKLQQKSSERRKANTFVIEGRREVAIAKQCGVNIFEFYLCPEIYKSDPLYPVDLTSDETIPVSLEVYNKIAYRKSTEGIIGLAYKKEMGLQDINLSYNPLLLVLETVEKPGNLGAVLRTADAAGVDAVIVCDLHTDIYNPNVIRSSLGCIFSNQLVVCKSEDLIKWLNKESIAIYAAITGTESLYYKMDFTIPAALVFGAESEGLSDKWLDKSINKIKIPMGGKIDSLNVSVSAAIVVYEAIRQRETNTTKT